MSIWPAETYPLEPVHGWIHRAADRNYAFSTDTFVASLGLSGKDWNYDELLKIVRQLPIRLSSQLEHNTPKRCPEGYEICGQKVPSRAISKSERRVCPQCLDDQRYVRAWFDFVPVSTCPYHNVALVSGLPNDPLDWRHTEIGWTRSGVKLGTEHAISQTATELDRYILATLTGVHLQQPAQLTGLSLDAVLSASICLGKLFRGDKKHISTVENVRQLYQVGSAPLFRGGDAVMEFLRRAEWLQPGYDRDRYHSRSIGVPKMLLTISNADLRHTIADSLARARVRNGVTTPSGKLAKYNGEADLLNLECAARQLGISTYSLQKLLDKLAINGKACQKSYFYRITYQEYKDVENYIDQMLDANEASLRLGCKPSDLESLWKRKLLISEFAKGGLRYYNISSIDALIDKLASLSNNIDNSNADTIVVYALKAGITLAAAISHIIRKNTLLVIGYDSMRPILHSLKVADSLVFSEEIRADQKRRPSIRPYRQVRNAITSAEAAARLGTCSNGLKKLINASIITTVEGPHKTRKICKDSLLRFENQFVKAADYASILNCHSTSALKILRAKGVQPINDWKGAGSRFVDHEQVLRITGLERPSIAGLTAWPALQTMLAENLLTFAVPATTRIIGTSAILVRATSGRWSFLVEQVQDSEVYSLTSKLTSRREPARLKKVIAASIDPSDIWPGATVRSAVGGGFVLVDEVITSGSGCPDDTSLIERAVTRSHQLHRLL